MAVTPRTAAGCAREAFRSFSWREYAPIMPILAAQMLYLVLGLNMGSAWGMATAGAFAASVVGKSALGYPGFLQLLPVSFAYLETLTFVLGGAVALPFLVVRVLDRTRTSPGGGPRVRPHLKTAIPATLIALAGAYGLILLWQGTGASWIRFLLGFAVPRGLLGDIANALAGSAIAFALTALVVYVPIAAVSEDAGLLAALRRGFAAGRRFFLGTYLFLFLFSLPALIVQLAVQLGAVFLTFRTRPENIVYLLLVYAVLGSLATYFVWSMAVRRYHGSPEEA